MAFRVKLIVPVTRIRLNIFPSDCIFREGVIRYIDSYQYVFPPINLTVCGLGADGSRWFEVSNPGALPPL